MGVFLHCFRGIEEYFLKRCWDHLQGFHNFVLQASQLRQPKTGSGQWSKILVVSLQNSRHSGNACWGIIWECWRKKKRREKGIFNLYPILIFQKLILSLWNKPLCLKSLWKPRQLPQSLRHCLIPSVPKLPRGNLDGWLLQIHRHGEVWDAGFRGVSPLGYTGSWNMRMWVGKNPCVWELPSSPAGFPNSGSPSSLLIGWRKLGSIIQLENSEFRSQVPQNFYPVAPGQLLQGDEKQLELRKGTSLIGGTWWLCRWLWASLLSTILG